MPTIVVRYRPTAEQADHNQRLVEAVYSELATTRPADFTYTTLRLADGTFIHTAEIGEGGSPLDELPSFAAFLDGIAERCESGHGPNPQAATVIGSFAASA
jgi:hypothetical protein